MVVGVDPADELAAVGALLVLRPTVCNIDNSPYQFNRKFPYNNTNHYRIHEMLPFVTTMSSRTHILNILH